MTIKSRNARIDRNGRVVIPASFRRALGIKPGGAVALRLKGEELLITTLQHRMAKAQKLVRKHVAPTTSLVDELIAERRDAAVRE